MKVLNTSHQIVDVIYNSEKSMMTINTPDNTFIVCIMGLKPSP